MQEGTHALHRLDQCQDFLQRKAEIEICGSCANEEKHILGGRRLDFLCETALKTVRVKENREILPTFFFYYFFNLQKGNLLH